MNGGNEFCKNEKKWLISFIFTLEIDPISFLRAARRGDIASCVEMLDAGVPFDTRDGLGSTALHHASLNNHTDIIDVILQKGVGVWMNAIILVGHHFTLQYTGTQLTHAGSCCSKVPQQKSRIKEAKLHSITYLCGKMKKRYVSWNNIK